jgi:hypothetical protein
MFKVGDLVTERPGVVEDVAGEAVLVRFPGGLTFWMFADRLNRCHHDTETIPPVLHETPSETAKATIAHIAIHDRGAIEKPAENEGSAKTATSLSWCRCCCPGCSEQEKCMQEHCGGPDCGRA